MPEIQVITSPIQLAEMPSGTAPDQPVVDSGFEPILLDRTMAAMQVAPRALATALPAIPKGDPLAQWLEQASGISADFTPPATTLPPEIEAMIAPPQLAVVIDEAEVLTDAPPALPVDAPLGPDGTVAMKAAPAEETVEIADLAPNPEMADQAEPEQATPRTVAAPPNLHIAAPIASVHVPNGEAAPGQGIVVPSAQPLVSPFQATPAIAPSAQAGIDAATAARSAPVQAVSAATMLFEPATALQPDIAITPDAPVDTPPPLNRAGFVAEGAAQVSRPLPQALREAVVTADQMPMAEASPLQQHRGDAPQATPTGQPQQASPHAPAPHADPRPVMQQVASAMVTTRKDATEIALSPEELGRLRLVISGPDRNHVTIWAERPETLDLVRRNADMLTQHLQEAGIETADMEFRRDDSGPWHSDDRGHTSAEAESSETPMITRVQITPPSSDRRVDIRL